MAYNKSYWDYQKRIGENYFHTHLQAEKFSYVVKPNDIVLDFGCGGGYILNSLNCKKKVGIEINPHAQKQAKTFGINIIESLENLKNEEFDVVISNSALEHVEYPLDILIKIYKVLKQNGKIIFSVPHEDLSYNFLINDINQHLYTWSPMSFGNLIQKAGFEIISVKVTKYIQPPFARQIYNAFGIKGYKFFGRLYREMRKLLTPQLRMGVSGDIIILAKKK